MPIETPGEISIRGRFGDLQVVADAEDVQIVVPPAVTHMDVHLRSFYQPIFFSIDGLAGSWQMVKEPGHSVGSTMHVALNGAVNVYFRKAYTPRSLSFREDLAGLPAFADPRMEKADDVIATAIVIFTAD